MKSLEAKSLAAIIMVAIAISPLVPVRQVEARVYGFGGGTFRRDAGYAEGVRGGAVVRAPARGVAVRGPRGNVVVGSRVRTLPVTARPVVVVGQTYYVDGDVYYQPYFDGDDVVYVVVPAPQ
jgi:hypothetical protein